MKHAMSFNAKATVSAKGQVSIPLALRKYLGIHAGTELIFTVHNDILEVQPVRRSIDMLFGCCKEKGESPMSVADMDAAIATAVSDNDVRTYQRKKKAKKDDRRRH